MITYDIANVIDMGTNKSFVHLVSCIQNVL